MTASVTIAFWTITRPFFAKITQIRFILNILGCNLTQVRKYEATKETWKTLEKDYSRFTDHSFFPDMQYYCVWVILGSILDDSRMTSCPWRRQIHSVWMTIIIVTSICASLARQKVGKPAVIFPGSKNPRRKNNRRANSTLAVLLRGGFRGKATPL